MTESISDLLDKAIALVEKGKAILKVEKTPGTTPAPANSTDQGKNAIEPSNTTNRKTSR